MSESWMKHIFVPSGGFDVTARYKLVALLLLCGSSLATQALAQTDADVAARRTPALHACETAPENGGTFQQAICLGEEASRQDIRLNATWRRIIVRLSPARRAALRREERAWIADRDKQCTDEAAEGANSTAKAMFADCMVDATIRRTIQLERVH